MEDEISIAEMMNFLMNKDKHDYDCTCNKCEKDLEDRELSITIDLDLKEILNNEE